MCEEPVVDATGLSRVVAWMMPDGADPEGSGGAVFVRFPDGTVEGFENYDAYLEAMENVKGHDWRIWLVGEETQA